MAITRTHIYIHIYIYIYTYIYILSILGGQLLSWYSGHCRLWVNKYYHSHHSHDIGSTYILYQEIIFNTMRLRQNDRHFADDILNRILLNWNISISNEISLKCVPKYPTNNIPALIQIMAWCPSDNKPISEPMKVSFLTRICISWPQWTGFYLK